MEEAFKHPPHEGQTPHDHRRRGPTGTGGASRRAVPGAGRLRVARHPYGGARTHPGEENPTTEKIQSSLFPGLLGSQIRKERGIRNTKPVSASRKSFALRRSRRTESREYMQSQAGASKKQWVTSQDFGGNKGASEKKKGEINSWPDTWETSFRQKPAPSSPRPKRKRKRKRGHVEGGEFEFNGKLEVPRQP